MGEHQHIRGSEACFPGKNCKFSSTEMENNLHQRPFFNVFFYILHVCSNKNERKERIQEDETGATIYIGRVLSTFLFNVQTNAVETSQAATMFEKTGKVSK